MGERVGVPVSLPTTPVEEAEMRVDLEGGLEVSPMRVVMVLMTVAVLREKLRKVKELTKDRGKEPQIHWLTLLDDIAAEVADVE